MNIYHLVDLLRQLNKALHLEVVGRAANQALDLLDLSAHQDNLVDQAQESNRDMDPPDLSDHQGNLVDQA